MVTSWKCVYSVLQISLEMRQAKYSWKSHTTMSQALQHLPLSKGILPDACPEKFAIRCSPNNCRAKQERCAGPGTHLKGMPGCRVDLVLRRRQDAHQCHVAAPVYLQDGVDGDDAAARITDQAAQQGDVAPALTPLPVSFSGSALTG